MLAIKYTPNIFLLSIYVSSLLQQDIRFVKVCVCVCVCVCWKFGNNYFWVNLLCIYWGKRQEHGICFLFVTYIFTRYLQNIHEKKVWTYENTHQKKFGPTIYPREKIRDQRRYGSTMARRLRDSQWHEIHGI